MKRNAFLEHIAWTGAGIAYSLSATGLLTGRAVAAGVPQTTDFVQISDSHIGFHQPANPNVSQTLEETVAAINALPNQPRFVIHTGDVTHLSKPAQFDEARSVLSQLRAPLVVLPGEHDYIGSDYNSFAQAFPQNGQGGKWHSWDEGGIHFVALINVFNFEKMGLLGNDQLAWLEKDLRAQDNATPIVVFAHVPLYALFAQWGWTTEDGSKALAMLQRFDRVTVLNGHIHQVIHHQEGNIVFASANATAYPQPAPGKAAQPGPLALPHDSLLRVIGYRTVELQNGQALIDDHALSG